MIGFIKKIVCYIDDAVAHNMLLTNAVRGYPNSILELAEFYYIERQDYVEAYAWADAAYLLNLPNALEVKRLAGDKLTDIQIKEAWEKARQYKLNFT
tara:strand:+ start:2049 stop:2339 length:291 start_codon:yes stop_codon:yes gene_type:complete